MGAINVPKAVAAVSNPEMDTALTFFGRDRRRITDIIFFVDIPDKELKRRSFRTVFLAFGVILLMFGILNLEVIFTIAQY